MRRSGWPGKQTKKRRRSQTRLGPKYPSLEASVRPSPLSLKPAISFWKLNYSRIVGLCLLGLLVWVVYLVFTLPDFFIYTAEIRGNQVLTPEEIYAASEIDTLSVFWVNPADVEVRVEALPNIRSAQVSVTLPAQVLIEVQERQPEMVWQTGDMVWWVDSEGTLVPPRPESTGKKKRLHIIDGDARPLELDDRIDAVLVQAAQMVKAQKPDLESLHYTQQFGLSYQTPEGWPVYLGHSLNMKAKLLVADSLREDLLTRQVAPQYIDVRDPLRVNYQE